MSSDNTGRVARVLSGALRVWGVSASVEAEAQRGEFIVRTPSMTLRISPRWLVYRDERLLATHAGLPGLLRTLREELAPAAPAGRLIIGSHPLS